VELSVKYILNDFAVLWQHVAYFCNPKLCKSALNYTGCKNIDLLDFICLINCAFVVEKDFNIIKMHGKTIKKRKYFVIKYEQPGT
jgi:hypothetical protein